MTGELPTKHDFLEDHGCLDAQEAWKNFGGLTIEQAYAKFYASPTHSFEDFMFMGEQAFAYYFAVLDRYVRQVLQEVDEERFDDLSGIRDSIWAHFAQPFDEEVFQERIRQRDLADDGLLTREVVALSEHVIKELPSLCVGSWPHTNVTEDGLLLTWRGLLKIAQTE